jgi:hypothetical protein
MVMYGCREGGGRCRAYLDVDVRDLGQVCQGICACKHTASCQRGFSAAHDQRCVFRYSGSV